MIAKWAQGIRGLFLREWRLQNRFWTASLSRLLLGPLLSALTVGLLYSGFFKVHPETSLGSLRPGTFSLQLACSFLIHSYLNGGYHFLSNKLLYEWHTGTLTLLWTLPLPKVLTFFGLCSVEILRCFLLTGLLWLTLAWVQPVPSSVFYFLLCLLIPVFAFGMILGLFKAGLGLFYHSRAELADPFYLGLVFTACLYIPKSFFPSWLQSLCEINPIFWLKERSDFLIAGQDFPLAGLAAAWASTVLVVAAMSFVTTKWGKQALEAGYA